MNDKYIILSLIILFLLTGCQTATDERTVTFSVFGEPAEFAAYQELTAAFETQFPGIHIELRHIPGQKEYRQRLATEFAGGSPSNVVLLNYRRFATFAKEGGLEPLGPYLASSETIHEEEFYPITLQSFQYEDQLWCIPQNLSSLVVYYNRDLFDAAGVDYPTNEWNWDDFLHAARALTKDLDDDGRIDQYGAGISPKLFRLAPFIWQNGGDIVDDPAAPTRLTLDAPAARAAFTWFVNLQTKEGVVPDAAAEAAEPSENRFLNGRMGMYFNSRRGTPTYRTITRFSWDVAPLPRGVQPAGILHSDAYCMTAATEDKEAAWTFIEFANSPAGQTIVAQSGRTVPSLISVAESPAFLSPDQPPANARIFLNTTPYIRGVPIMDGWVGVEKIAGEEIKKAFYGDAAIDEAIQNAAQLTQPYFDKAASHK
jgi:multiple sugar transport system substrate-binding protein